MNYVQETGLQVNVSDYESKYQGELKPGETLDTLYERFNIHRPENFTGHSLSVSDVIVLESGGDKRAFYVDSFGFCEVEDFFAEKLKRSEITFTVAECGEFHSLGRYRDDISNAEEAIEVWKICKWIWCLARRWIWICCVIIRRSMWKKLPFKRFVNWLKICRM